MNFINTATAVTHYMTIRNVCAFHTSKKQKEKKTQPIQQLHYAGISLRINYVNTAITISNVCALYVLENQNQKKTEISNIVMQEYKKG